MKCTKGSRDVDRALGSSREPLQPGNMQSRGSLELVGWRKVSVGGAKGSTAKSRT